MDQRPRSPRVPVEFPLAVEGTDQSGQTFQIKGTAVKISHGGATIIVDVDIPVGSPVTLVQASGAKLAAEVNGSWIDDLDGKRRIGVRLLDANGWFSG
ncbi:MAG TPA: PilZ domain-containing protein [Pyrinomonadaceae bacterium]